MLCAVLALASFNDHEGLAVFHRLAVFHENLDHGARSWRGNLVHRFHRFDDHQRLACFHSSADFDEGARAGFGPEVGSSDHWRGDHARVLRRIDRDRYGSDSAWRCERRLNGPRAPDSGAEMPRNAYRYAVTFQCDLGQAGFIEQLR